MNLACIWLIVFFFFEKWRKKIMAIQGPFRIRKYGNLETFFHYTKCQFGVIFRVRKGPHRTQSTWNDLAPAPASLVVVRWVQSAGHTAGKRQTLIDEWDPAPSNSSTIWGEVFLNPGHSFENMAIWRHFEIFREEKINQNINWETFPTLKEIPRKWQFGDSFSWRKKSVKMSIWWHFDTVQKKENWD